MRRHATGATLSRTFSHRLIERLHDSPSQIDDSAAHRGDVLDSIRRPDREQPAAGGGAGGDGAGHLPRVVREVPLPRPRRRPPRRLRPRPDPGGVGGEHSGDRRRLSIGGRPPSKSRSWPTDGWLALVSVVTSCGFRRPVERYAVDRVGSRIKRGKCSVDVCSLHRSDDESGDTRRVELVRRPRLDERRSRRDPARSSAAVWLRCIAWLDVEADRDRLSRYGATVDQIAKGQSQATSRSLSRPASCSMQLRRRRRADASTRSTLAQQSATLARLRDLLLPKLVTGQIDVSTLDLDALVSTGSTAGVGVA